MAKHGGKSQPKPQGSGISKHGQPGHNATDPKPKPTPPKREGK